MRRKLAFTLIELLVVISIIALLLAIVMPSSEKPNSKLEVLSVGVIKKYGNRDDTFLENHDNKMFEYGDNLWLNHLAEELGDISDIRYCPEILAGVDDLIAAAKSSAAAIWGTSKEPWVWKWTDSSGDEVYDAGGLCFNGWLYQIDDRSPAASLLGGMSKAQFSNMNEVKTPFNTPVFADGNWVDTWPQTSNTVVSTFDYSLGDRTGGTNQYAMGRLLVNRHRNMKINTSFIDGHVEMIDMEDLWTLSWHKGSEPNHDFVLPEGVNR